MATKTFTVSKQYFADRYTGHANPGDAHVVIGPWAANSYVTRALLYAPVSFSGMTAINEARIFLRADAPSSGYHTKGASTATLEARRKTADWSETSGGVSSNIDELWGGDGDAYVESSFADDVGLRHYNMPNLTNDGWYSIPITEIVRAWFNGSPNYGVLLFNATSESQGASQYGKQYSSRHVSGSQPYIWIDYSTNTAPNAPTNLSPSGWATVHTGTTVTLSGQMNDPDANEYVSGAHIELWNDSVNVKYIDNAWYPAGQYIAFSKSFNVPYGNTWYQWRARTRDKNGMWGPWTGFHRFKANTPPSIPSISISQTPVDEIRTLVPTFNITRNDSDAPYGDYMGAYQIHMYTGLNSDSGTFKWDSGEQVAPSNTSTVNIGYSGTALSWRTQYAWYARTRDMNGAWSGWRGMNFSTYASPRPSGIAPDGSVVVGSLTPTLQGVRGDSNHTISNYQIEVYESNGTTLKWSSGTLTTGITNGASFSKAYTGAALSYNTTYKWRARITGNIGGTSDWTVLATFVTPSSATPTQDDPVGGPITWLTPAFQGTWNEAFNGIQIIVYEANGTTVKWDSGIVAKTSSTSYAHTYAGPALAWNTSYKWKIRVRRSADNLFQPYTGLTQFTTDSAGQPTLTAPIDNSWQTTITPTFTGTTFNAEVISTYRIRLYEADGTTLTWDSGDLAGSGTTFSKVYNGAVGLVPGRTYKWQARYIKSTGPTGNYSAMEDFHVNADPQSPSAVTPETGAVVVNSLTPEFSAVYEDVDASAWGDIPSLMRIEVRNNATDALIATQDKNTGLVQGMNAMVWDGTPALAYETMYKWRVQYTDSKGAAGAWSAWNTFKPSQASSVTITGPVGTIFSPQVPVTWTFTSPGGKMQGSYQVRVIRNSDEILVYDSGTIISSENDHLIPAGYLVNNTEYTFEVTTVDTDGI